MKTSFRIKGIGVPGKIITVITLFSFFLALASCVTQSYQKTMVEIALNKQKKKKEKIKVLELETKQGEKYRFSKERPGYLGKQGITVKSQKYEKIEVKKSEIEKIVTEKEGQSRLIKKDGSTFRFTSAIDQGDSLKLISAEGKEELILYSNISWLKIKRPDTLGTFLVTSAMIAIVLYITGSLVVQDINESFQDDCVATMITRGSSLYAKLNDLREFRDKILVWSYIGQVLVSLYYECSLYLSRMIQQDESLRRMTRIGLVPVIAFCLLVNQTLGFG
jgi:hypothetical protein